MTETIEREDLAPFAQMPSETQQALRARHGDRPDGELAYLVEFCRDTGLSPWGGEVWLEDAEIDTDGPRVGVGRDGLLRAAERRPGWLGFDSAPIYQSDRVRFADPDPSAPTMRARAGIHHVHGAASLGSRGKLVGAWAVAEIEGRPPRLFEARLEDFMPRSEAGREGPWTSQPATMIEKCAIAAAVRPLALISRAYVHEEMSRARDAAPVAAERDEEEDADRQPTVAEVASEIGLDEDRARALAAAVDVLNARAQIEGGQRLAPSVLRLRLAGVADEVRDGRVDEILTDAAQGEANAHEAGR